MDERADRGEIIRPPDRWLQWVTAALCVVLPCVALVGRPRIDATTIVLVAMFATVIIVLVRFAGSRVEIGAEGIVARNPFSTVRATWDEIDGVTVGSYTTYFETARIVVGGRALKRLQKLVASHHEGEDG